MEQNEKLKQIKYAMNTRMFLLAAGIFLIFTAVTSTGQDALRWFGIVQVVTDYDKDVAEGKIVPPAEEENTETVSSEETVPEEAAEADPDTASETDDKAAETTDAAAETADSAAEAADTDAEAADDAAEAAEATDTDAESAGAAAGETQAADEASREIDVPALKKDMETLGITLADLRILGIACIIIAVIRIIAGVICVKFSNRVDRADITFKTVIALTVAEVLYAAVTFFMKALFVGSLLYTILILGALYLGAIRMRKLHKADPERVFAVPPARRPAPQAAAPKKSLHDRAKMNTDIENEPEMSGTEEAAEIPEAPETPDISETPDIPETPDISDEKDDI